MVCRGLGDRRAIERDIVVIMGLTLSVLRLGRRCIWLRILMGTLGVDLWLIITTISILFQSIRLGMERGRGKSFLVDI